MRLQGIEDCSLFRRAPVPRRNRTRAHTSPLGISSTITLPLDSSTNGNGRKQAAICQRAGNSTHHGETAAHTEHLPRDEVGIRRDEERNRAGDVFRAAEATKWNRTFDRFDHGGALRTAGDAIEQGRLGRTGATDVDVDAAAATPPRWRIASTVVVAPVASMSSTATRAPSAASRRAIARPIPLPAPVTRAVLPARLGAGDVTRVARGISRDGRSNRGWGRTVKPRW